MKTPSLSYSQSFVSSFFDDFAEQYYKVSWVCLGADSYLRKRALNELNWREGMTVCDMMSGSGNNFSIINDFTKQKGKIIAIDFSTKMNRLASAEGVEVKEENALHTSLENNSVDAVVCSFGMKTMHTSDYDNFAKEIQRVLKPNGQFMVMELSIPKNVLMRTIMKVYLGMMLPVVINIAGNKFLHHLLLYPYIKSFGDITKVETAFKQKFPHLRRISYIGGVITGVTGSMQA